MTEVNNKQICMEEVLDKKVIQIKFSTLLGFFIVATIFGSGISVGLLGKDDAIRKSQRFGYNSAILDYPGAGLAQAGRTFCAEQSGKSFCAENGNYYITKRLNKWNFQISKDQSLPEFKIISDEQIFRHKFQRNEE